MAPPFSLGLTYCYDLISMLATELRTAKQLREQLESDRPADPATLDRLCRDLETNIADAAQAAGFLREELCDAHSARRHTTAETGQDRHDTR